MGFWILSVGLPFLFLQQQGAGRVKEKYPDASYPALSLPLEFAFRKDALTFWGHFNVKENLIGEVSVPDAPHPSSTAPFPVHLYGHLSHKGEDIYCFYDRGRNHLFCLSLGDEDIHTGVRLLRRSESGELILEDLHTGDLHLLRGKGWRRDD